MANYKSLVKIKREILLDLDLLCRIHPLPVELSKLVCKPDCLDKPTQNLFCHLSHYLVSVIDPLRCSNLPWPIYDTTTQRIYRKEFSNFISEYNSKGLLSPVMASYLVNPGCHKVVILTLQLCHLALEKALCCRMAPIQRTSYLCVKERFKNHNVENIISEAETIKSRTANKYGHFKNKICAYEKVANAFKTRIGQMESKLKKLTTENYILNQIDKFIKDNSLDDTTMKKIYEIADIDATPEYFEQFLIVMDKEMDDLESDWNKKTVALYEESEKTAEVMNKIIARHNGEADRNSYLLEYHPETDTICMSDLEKKVSSEQKYILRNIFKDGRLNFPNLLRGFVIGVSDIAKNSFSNEVSELGVTLRFEAENYQQIVIEMREALRDLDTAESMIQMTPLIANESVSPTNSLVLPPPLPDFADIKFSRFNSDLIYVSLTPPTNRQHKFNLRKNSTSTIMRLQPKSLETPYHKSLPERSFTSHYAGSSRRNVFNASASSEMLSRHSRNVTDNCIFTRQQISRLLSTKKTVKHRNRSRMACLESRKCNLFDSSGMNGSFYRVQSSPNLCDEKVSSASGNRRLSVMAEDTISQLNVSNITVKSGNILSHELTSPAKPFVNVAYNNEKVSIIIDTPEINELDKESSFDRVNGEQPAQNGSGKVEDKQHSRVTPKHYSDELIAKVLNNAENSTRNQLESSSNKQTSRNGTPETSQASTTKSNSLEKLINRFKSIRAMQLNDDLENFETIDEEKENHLTSKRVLLPDLLSPNSVGLTEFNMNFIEKSRKRESLGTVLGVDVSILDQFDID